MEKTKAFLTIHGHFYQPPRENPWLEAIELQDSALPFHDWNERITKECYNPNSVSKIVDSRNRILDVVNNYEHMSFNFGPTLLSWLEIYAPLTYERIIKADIDSITEHNGHGNAIAQVYNHMIMPLANENDKQTQVIWGIRDFEYRFGRKPEGIWLAETAVDDDTLRVLVEQGIKFTILSPYQALKIRKKAYEQQMKSMEEIEKTNRLIAFFTNDINYKSGKDIRLYQVQNLINSKGAESYFVSRKEISKNIGNRMGKSDGFSGFIIGISEGIAYLLVAYQALLGVISVGQIVTYAGVINQFTTALSYFVININEIIVHTNRFLSTFEYLNIPIEEDIGKKTMDSEKETIDTIEFCNVSFAYPNSEKFVLRNINMTIKGGEQLAVVGTNGSGKTTLIKLLCRLYKPTSGTILLNGIDINDIEINSYLKMLSVVFQDFSLFSIPIVDNICIGNNIDKDRVYKIIDQVGLKERIDKEKAGVNTPVFHELYENGIELSGGEAQKLALARAIYKNSPLLILDEPTAALDPLSEADLYSKFSDIAKGKTAIFISHRLASCKFCDKIAVFDNGNFIQFGSHKELMQCTEGKYYMLWNAQAQYYNDKIWKNKGEM